MGERLSDTVTKIDRWADLDAEIDARYGDHGRSYGPKRVILPRAEYDVLMVRAKRGDQSSAAIGLILGLTKEAQ
jgi:hypothetical protein